MLEGKAFVEDTDMPLKMQLHAMSFASQALDYYDVSDCKSIAGFIKKEFDSNYGKDGNVWWVQSLGVISPILQGLSFTLQWGVSTSFSSKQLHLPPTISIDARGRSQEQT